VAFLFRGNAQQKRLSIQQVIHKGVAEKVKGDPARIRQVLSNFNSNAIKFTGEGHVHIHVHLVGQNGNTDMVRFEVVDTGVGIQEEKLNTVF